VAFTQYGTGDEIKQSEMGKKCGAHQEEDHLEDISVDWGKYQNTQYISRTERWGLDRSCSGLEK
jgi:hypothetical protein